jgi:hypothetical protein
MREREKKTPDFKEGLMANFRNTVSVTFTM